LLQRKLSCRALSLWAAANVVLGSILALFVLTAESTAATPQVLDTSGFNHFTVLGQALTVNQSTINGNTGDEGAGGNMNNAVFNGDFAYSGATNPISQTAHNSVTGSLLGSSSSVALAFSSLSEFSRAVAGMTATTTFSDQNQTIRSITGLSQLQLNVIDINAGNCNGGGTVTIYGDASQIFYINVNDSNFTVKNMVLSGGVQASNIYWNLLKAPEAFSNGTFFGNLISVNSPMQLTRMNVVGNIYGQNPQIYESAVQGITPASTPTIQPVPEPSTWMGFGAAVCGIGLAVRSQQKRGVPTSARSGRQH
jgi:hypothetical protein